MAASTKISEENSSTFLNVLELYSGIGGTHCALEESGISYNVVAAADINTVTNSIYTHNFPQTKLLNRCIESLSIGELDKLSPDMITMSPPCQPFCRVGKQKDSGDIRTVSFFHVLQVLPKLRKLPRYLLLENVKGFDTSDTRLACLKTLKKCGYGIQEFLLSPLQFGIPNSRLRYFLIAKKQPLAFHFSTQDQVHTEIPASAEQFCHHKLSHITRQPLSCREMQMDAESLTGCDKCGNKCPRLSGAEHQIVNNSESSESQTHNLHSLEVVDRFSETQLQVSEPSLSTGDSSSDDDDTDSNSADVSSQLFSDRYRSICHPIAHYLEEKPAEYFQSFLLPEKFFRRFWVMDIVTPNLKNSCCFTKRYARHMEGSGSVIRMNENNVDLLCFKKERIYNDEIQEAVRSIRLRYFTPQEIANLMCFPQNFSFPDDVSSAQCYRSLGNSLNVHVVAVLLRLLVMGDEITED